MLILLSNASGEPLYEQIYQAIVQKILDQELQSEDPLPSIRLLAKNLKISVITVKKAYDLLEEAGFIYTRPGIGCFVASAGEGMVKERLLSQAENAFDEGIKLSKQAGLNEDAIAALFETILRMYKEESS